METITTEKERHDAAMDRVGRYSGAIEMWFLDGQYSFEGTLLQYLKAKGV